MLEGVQRKIDGASSVVGFVQSPLSAYIIANIARVDRSQAAVGTVSPCSLTFVDVGLIASGGRNVVGKMGRIDVRRHTV